MSTRDWAPPAPAPAELDAAIERALAPGADRQELRNALAWAEAEIERLRAREERLSAVLREARDYAWHWPRGPFRDTAIGAINDALEARGPTVTILYPSCPDCGGVLTPRTPDSPHQWRDGAELATGVVCDCGYASNHPPICLRRNGRLYVRVPDSLQNTEHGRIHALQRVPNTWRRGSFTYQWLEEVRAGSYRWWVFKQEKQP